MGLDMLTIGAVLSIVNVTHVWFQFMCVACIVYNQSQVIVVHQTKLVANHRFFEIVVVWAREMIGVTSVL